MEIVTDQAPLRPQQSTQLATPPKTTVIFAGWIILVLGFILALIPGIGLSMWWISVPVCLASFSLGVIGAATGKPIGGVVLIISSIVAFFVFLIVPVISLMIFAASQDQPQ